MRLRIGMVSVLIMGTLVVGAEPSGAARAVIRAKGSPGSFRWEPAIRRINKGDKIVWKNRTDFTHTVTAYSPNWNKDTRIASGESTRKRFRKRGRFLFRCTVPGHSSLADDGTCSGMCGKVRVRKD